MKGWWGTNGTNNGQHDRWGTNGTNNGQRDRRGIHNIWRDILFEIGAEAARIKKRVFRRAKWKDAKSQSFKMEK